ncbi:MAG TPA: glycosyltransferase family 4 protein [Vicinamibacterales bacterium]|jgi:glycosyltransferase involved in cell wall biosynthesis
MRIAFVIPGGVDRSGRHRVVPMFLWLIERLARRHELHVFVVDYEDRPSEYPLLGATVRDIGRPPRIPGMRRTFIRRRLENALNALEPFDVLHAYWGMPAGIVAAHLRIRRRTPLILTLDSGELVRLDDIGYGLQRRGVDRRALRFAMTHSAAVTVSTSFMATLASAHGVRPTVLPIGVDASLFPHAVRSEGPPWRLLRVASINRVKDYPTLLHAMAHIVSIIPSVHLDVVGEDTLGGAMTTLAASLGLTDHVTFHRMQPTDRVAELMARAHLHVVSSRHEAAGVTVLEAACTGLPTVGTAVGYVSDWREDRAVAVPVGDARALAAATLDLLRDPDRRLRIGERARDWAVRHDADWTARQFEDLYARIVTTR